jgi:flagellar hook-associated protein 2
MTQQVAAQDASAKIDGITVTSSTNTLSTALTGLSINLLKTNSGAPITMTTSRDDTSIKTSINSFITSYNALQKLVKTLTSYDTVKKEAAILNGEITVRSALTQIRGLFSQSYGTSTLTSVVDIGITTQNDGSLKFDATKFDSAFSTNRNGVVSVLAQSSTGTEGEGFAGKVKTLVSSFLDTEGLLEARTTGLNANIKTIDDKKFRMEERLLMIEQRYRTQFGALDLSMSKMQSLSTYLGQQLAALPKSS